MTREEILNGYSPFDKNEERAIIVLHSEDKCNLFVELYNDSYEDKSAYKVYKESEDGSLEFVSQYWHYGTNCPYTLNNILTLDDVEDDILDAIKDAKMSLDDFYASSTLPIELFEFLLK